MSLASWFRGCQIPDRTSVERAPPGAASETPRRAVPLVPCRLELLEDRSVPSTLTVLNNSDAGAGSLRATIAAAHSGDTIVFDSSLVGPDDHAHPRRAGHRQEPRHRGARRGTPDRQRQRRQPGLRHRQRQGESDDCRADHRARFRGARGRDRQSRQADGVELRPERQRGGRRRRRRRGGRRPLQRGRREADHELHDLHPQPGRRRRRRRRFGRLRHRRRVRQSGHCQRRSLHLHRQPRSGWSGDLGRSTVRRLRRGRRH